MFPRGPILISDRVASAIVLVLVAALCIGFAYLARSYGPQDLVLPSRCATSVDCSH